METETRIIDVVVKEKNDQYIFTCPYCRYKSKKVIHKHGKGGGLGVRIKHCQKSYCPKGMDMNYEFNLVK